ncbi:MAG: YicC family protein [Deltaproteobacteria bacterium]|nr:YicC family protein [Deltaproteobacteria bacterium]
MKSMTGYGNSEIETNLGKIIVEAKSENYRFLDINMQLPESVLSVEPDLIEIIKQYVIRGKVRILFISEEFKRRTPVMNIELAKDSFRKLEKLKKELVIQDKTRLEHVLLIKEFFSYESKPTLSKVYLYKMKTALRNTMRNLDEARISEGKKIERDLKSRIRKLEKIMKQVNAKRSDFKKTFSENIKSRINKLLDDKQLDESRLNQEVAMMAERTDITEEIIRLKAHISKLNETIKKNHSIGRECDFLLQEMNREAGTISAKSKDASISHLIIDFRSEIEKMREQVQNIE